MIVKNCFWCKSENLIKKTSRKDHKSILQCQDCSLLMVGEIPENVSDLYQEDYFEKSSYKNSIGYENYLSSPVANLIGKYAFVKLFLPRKFNKCLDIGCADGSLVEIFKSYGYDAYGLDISEDAVQEGNRKGLNISASNLKFFPFGVADFDFVSAFDLMEHLDSPKETLREVQRVLKEEGIFFYSTLCITKVSEDEFWFNNSLEHFIYYDRTILTELIEEVFGKQNVANISIEINGVFEIFGIAKKGKISDSEKSILDKIKNDAIFLNNKKDNYYLSLLYNQLGKSRESKMALDSLDLPVKSEEFIFLTFVSLFTQGRFFDAVDLVKKSKLKISLSNAIFWQTYAFVLDATKELEIISNSNEILEKKESIITEKDLIIEEKNRLLDERLAFMIDINSSLIIYPILVLRNKTKKTLRQMKALLSHIERSVIYFGRNHINENTKKYLRLFLPKQYRVKVIKIKNEKWEGPLISVVTPYYNRANTIDETIESVLKQTFQDFEYIIVDDGSTDLESIKAFDRINNPKIKKVRQENQGVASARNNGIHEAKGKYILCLDSDDTIDPTYLEKAALIMELNPQYDIVYSNMKFFGLEDGTCCFEPYFDARDLIENNKMTTASIFKKEYWKKTGGYKSNLGFEDWEFWINMVEIGARVKLIPELLFNYRKAESSRFTEDSKRNEENLKKIKGFHPHYFQNISKLSRQYKNKYIFEDESGYYNIENVNQYLIMDNGVKKKSILILMPWLTFGGAETVVYNLGSKIKKEFNISIMTGLKSEHEWEYKFKEVTSNIYHLPNLLENEEDYLNFILNYIKTRNVDIVHIVHNSCFYNMLSEIKKKFPNIKVVSTAFNAVADHFENSIRQAEFIDAYTTDNTKVMNAYDKQLAIANVKKAVIYNGIDCDEKFNPVFYDRLAERNKLDIGDGDVAIYFMGRLSSEKNPDIFVDAAKEILKKHSNVKFFVIGDGPMRSAIKKSINEISNKNISYLGYQTDIPRYLSTADIFVLPSKAEGFPLSNIEAMSMGVCVIASDVGGVSDAIKDGETGFLMQPNSALELVEKIEFAILKKEILEKISKNARKSVEDNFSIKTLADNYRKLYQSLHE